MELKCIEVSLVCDGYWLQLARTFAICVQTSSVIRTTLRNKCY